ncbi:hypothetical protein DB356_08245 [Pseudomonas congelans]|uniref:hypothetical protein n=1 Tax=Pseudomonas congelans TaxID=200452 RepID=UPI001BDCEAAD|nr:hypothetical protein [Pseudomonas congelans]QVX14697.1 hypothetical protein DB356_08245 [Pseudomonas congelans]
MKLPGLSSSPPKTPDVTPNAPKPEAKPSQDASKPADTQNNSGNGGNSATGNFSNVAQGTGSLASGGASLYRADQSSQNQPQATQGNQGAQGNSGGVSYGSNSGGSIPPSLQNNPSSQQSQGLSGSDGLSKLLSPLAKMLEKVLGTMLQHSGGGSSMQYVGGNASAQNKPTPDVEINIQLGTAGRNSAQQAAPLAQLQPAATPSSATTTAAPSQVTGNAGAQPAAESEKDTSTKPTEATGRPAGDTRSAEEIIEANPILAKLGDQKDINREGAYKQLGDWTENNKDPEARADAAYNAARVLNYIDASHGASGSDRGDKAGNGDLEGITDDGDARHGTPAGNWKDFTEKGYGALKDDHRLDKTNDTHVKADGSTKNDLPWAAGEAGKALWFIPGLSRVLTGVGDSDGSLGGMIKGGIEGGVETAVDALEGIARGGKNPATALFGAYTGALAGNEAAPEEVRKVAGML